MRMSRNQDHNRLKSSAVNLGSEICWLCDGPLTPSKEHVFPRGIGGTKTVSGFICNKCNNYAGSKWDKHLMKLLVFNRMEHQLIDSTSAALHAISEGGVDGHRRFKLFNFRDVRVSDTTQHISENPDGSVQIDVSAGNLKALKKALNGLKRKYPQLESVDVTQTASTRSSGQIGKLKSNVAFNVPGLEKSVIKTAMAWAFATGSDPRDCELGYHYLRGIPVFGSRQEFGLIDVKLPAEPMVARGFHSVAVRRDGERGSIVALVDYFGWFQFHLPLSIQYSGETMLHMHAVNVDTGDELEFAKSPIRESFDGPWGAIEPQIPVA